MCFVGCKGLMHCCSPCSGQPRGCYPARPSAQLHLSNHCDILIRQAHVYEHCQTLSYRH